MGDGGMKLNPSGHRFHQPPGYDTSMCVWDWEEVERKFLADVAPPLSWGHIVINPPPYHIPLSLLISFTLPGEAPHRAYRTIDRECDKNIQQTVYIHTHI